tara:strand:+ start:341 stop:487 length:147 start_codon:yes stop_codon:yes gene_type:complete
MTEIRKVSIALGAGLWRSMFALIEDDKIVELAPTEEELRSSKEELRGN